MSETNRTVPVVGMVGGGQLARMTHQAAIALGVDFRVLAARPTDSAARVVADDWRRPGPRRPARLRQRQRRGDVRPRARPQPVWGTHDAGIVLRPGPEALHHAQDKLVMRTQLSELGAPCPRWRGITSLDEVTEFAGRPAGRGAQRPAAATTARRVGGRRAARPRPSRARRQSRSAAGQRRSRSARTRGPGRPLPYGRSRPTVVETVQRGGSARSDRSCPHLSGRAVAARLAIELAAALTW